MNKVFQVNIKGERARKAISRLAGLTGESLTDAVVIAVEERLERIDRKASREGIADKLMELGRQYSALPDRDTRTVDEILGYDENGLPG